MGNNISTYIIGLIKDDEVTNTTSIGETLSHFDFILPQDYVEFMKFFIAGEGPIGNNSWITLWKIEDLIQINSEYSLMQDIPEYFLFGKDAADTGYAFHKSYSTYHSFGLMSNFSTDSMEFCGQTFADFMRHLYNK